MLTDQARAGERAREAGAGARLASSVSLGVAPLVALYAVVLLVGAALRLPWLDRIPPGLQFDEAYNAIDAWRVVGGARDIFFPANGGREPLLSYWQAGFLALFGPNVAALRLASAVVGLLTLVVVGLGVARLFRGRPDARWLGVLSAAVLAVTYWHLHFSRYAIRAILVPLLMALVFTAYFVGSGPRAPRVLPLFAAGIALAASVYAHPTGRLLPLALAAYSAWLAWTDRRHAVGYLLSLALVGAVSFALFLPLGFFFLDHPWLFVGHPSDVAIFDPTVHGGSLWRGLLGQALAVLGLVFVRGDRSNFHNLPFRPAFDPLLAVFFVIGLVALARDTARAGGLARAPYVLLLAWGAVATLPTLLSDAAPNFSRAIGVLPVLCVVAAAGLSAVRLPPLRRWPLLVPLLVLTISGAWTARDYFGAWAPRPQLYYSYDADKEDAARQVLAWGEQGHVYMAPLWATHATLSFLTRHAPPTALDMERGLVLPASDGRDAYYVLPAQLERQARRVGGWLGEAAESLTTLDRQDQPLLLAFRLPSPARPRVGAAGVTWGAARPADTRSVAFVGAPQLVGVSGDERAAPGDTARYTLYWRLPAPTERPLTLFAHLVDSSGGVALQDDHAPLQASYPTTRWRADDIILDQVQLRLPDSLPPGAYRVRVGWYDPATGERLPLAEGGTELYVGQLSVAVGQ